MNDKSRAVALLFVFYIFVLLCSIVAGLRIVSQTHAGRAFIAYL